MNDSKGHMKRQRGNHECKNLPTSTMKNNQQKMKKNYEIEKILKMLSLKPYVFESSGALIKMRF